MLDKERVMERFTIEYQLYDGELDEYDAYTMALKSEMAKHKVCSKNVDIIIGVNGLFDRMLKNSDEYCRGDFLDMLQYLKELYDFYPNDYSKIKQFSSLMKQYGDDLLQFPLPQYDYQQMINLYMECVSKAKENALKCLHEVSDIIDMVNERMVIDESYDERQKIKYVCQRIKYETLHYYQNERYYWRHNAQSGKAIGDLYEFILVKWLNCGQDYHSYDWLCDSQVAFIDELMALDFGDVEFRHNKNNEYDIKKTYVCEKLGIPYNNFKDKVHKIKKKNVKNLGTMEFVYNKVEEKAKPIHDYEEHHREIQKQRQDDWIFDDYEDYEDYGYLESTWDSIKDYY